MGYRTIEVGVQTGVTSGSCFNAPWNDLLPDTNYEWYATVSDGVNTTISPVWNFTTESCFPLTLDNTGAGNPPSAIPASSDWLPQRRICLRGDHRPDRPPCQRPPRQRLERTQDDTSASLTNQVVMPAESHEVQSHYEQDLAACHALTLGYTGRRRKSQRFTGIFRRMLSWELSGR